MLRPGEMVPDFTVNATDGRRVSYTAIWQRNNLLLVSLPVRDDAAKTAYLGELSAHADELRAYDTECVVTTDRLEQLPGTAVVVIADRWGEIYHVKSADRVDDLPRIPELVEWLRYVQVQCPECQGETR